MSSAVAISCRNAFGADPAIQRPASRIASMDFRARAGNDPDGNRSRPSVFRSSCVWSNTIVGFFAGHLSRRSGCDGELQWINVVPIYRGIGIAAALLQLLDQSTSIGKRGEKRADGQSRSIRKEIALKHVEEVIVCTLSFARRDCS